ncbi:hypothetical protein T310_5023 [Rasamsonia emersonii CBS 393.64]|uniref:Uncharacterized protein n=1 Tax=Rasamsonia emersonii (strain ATCC 16479 / CBS 393.64 / IMI 116815) TaxID=1408163 RepID=A0A0F4YTI2_RASE3|nr:hypothetical protein T310_5023 [Rasamsonia emersonii CBS 393.64]KKA20938.1 hypothetical protein T310_5023 [Rasamsonia emersonii CBS 393.64]
MMMMTNYSGIAWKISDDGKNELIPVSAGLYSQLTLILTKINKCLVQDRVGLEIKKKKFFTPDVHLELENLMQIKKKKQQQQQHHLLRSTADY